MSKEIKELLEKAHKDTMRIHHHQKPEALMSARWDIAEALRKVLSLLSAPKPSNERLEEALKRLNSGAAIYVGGYIPMTMRPELKARYRFTELVLEGLSVKEAEEQARNEARIETQHNLDQALKISKKEITKPKPEATKHADHLRRCARQAREIDPTFMLRTDAYELEKAADLLDSQANELKRLNGIFERWEHMIDPNTDPGGCANCFHQEWKNEQAKRIEELEKELGK